MSSSPTWAATAHLGRHGGPPPRVAVWAHWDMPAERVRVRPALPESWEDLLHDARVGEDVLVLAEDAPALRGRRLPRAIGVVYRPQTERLSHSLHAVRADRFPAVIQLDRTRAVEPLEPEPPSGRRARLPRPSPTVGSEPSRGGPPVPRQRVRLPGRRPRRARLGAPLLAEGVVLVAGVDQRQSADGASPSIRRASSASRSPAPAIASGPWASRESANSGAL